MAKNSDEWLFTLLIYIAIGMIVWVTVVGGIVCIIDQQYIFRAYLQDLTNVVPYLFGAVVAVLLRSFTRKRNGGSEPPS